MLATEQTLSELDKELNLLAKKPARPTIQLG